jgi:hypothetical protein
MDILSEAELEGLQTGTVPKDDLPPPEPRVLEKIKELQGKQISANVTEAVPEDVKVAFVAHIIEGAEFKRVFDLFDGRGKLTFKTVSGEVEDSLMLDSTAEEKRINGADKTNRAQRYINYLMVKSIDSYIKDSVHVNTMSYDDLAKNVSNAELALIKTKFMKFQDELKKLIEWSDQPSFWQTPSFG